jgi:chromosome segregation ATPase
MEDSKPNIDYIQRDIGRMESEINSLKTLLEEVREDLRQVRRSFDELRGGTKFLLGAAAMSGAFMTIIYNWLTAKH